LKLDAGENGEASMVNIFGGKITTFRKLAESMMDIVEEQIGAKQPEWTNGASLPGGSFKAEENDTLIAKITNDYPFLNPKIATRLLHTYGMRTFRFLDGATSLEDMGEDFSGDTDAGLYAREIDYLIDTEWVRDADDVLWRRSKLGIKIKGKTVEQLQAYIEKRRAPL